MSFIFGRPSTFDRFWAELDEELALYPSRPLIELMPRHSTSFASLYWVSLTSIGPYRIGGYFSVPHGSGPFPALMNTPGYGSVNHIPHYNDRMRYVVLSIMHRGQRLADQPFAASYPGLFTHKIENPGTYVFRSIVADLLRGAEFLLSRPEVDRSRVSIKGNDLALITASRRPGFSVAQVAGLLFYRIMEARERTQAYPVEELNDYLRAFPDRQNIVAHTLSFFDASHHVPQLRAKTSISVGGPGTIGGREWMKPLVHAHGSSVEQYDLTNEGGTDNDRNDAWLAEHLGVPQMSRFRQIFD